MSTLRLPLLLLLLALVACSCARQRHRVRADIDSYQILHQKTKCAPWYPSGFRIDVDPSSRLYDRSPTDDPCLPQPAPHLYAYALPQVQPRDAARFTPPSGQEAEPAVDLTADLSRLGQYDIRRFPEQDGGGKPAILRVPPEPVPDIEPVVYVQREQGTPQELPTTSPTVTPWQGFDAPEIVPIEPSAWELIPASCLPRSLEFSSVVTEYERSFGQPPDPSFFDKAEKLALEDLLELALNNSREYQTEKEILYQAALTLSLERYAYQLKFTPNGNGITANWEHLNEIQALPSGSPDWVTTDTLGLPNGVALEKVLATGGNFLAQFANNVVLTFNGPDGFVADVGSELLAEFTQSILQRDIAFESLTQSERNVVYAARNYTRFRRRFFRDIARAYYQLLLTYRNIEINMLDFFSNQRGYQQGRYEYELRESVPLNQVDQFEQDALQSRSRVISSCNQLEENLDQLKLQIGIPPETPINLDLRELETITARDEITVAAEMASRAFRNLTSELGSSGDRQVQVVNAAIRLAQRVLAQLDLEARQSASPTANVDTHAAVKDVLNKLRVEDAALTATSERRILELELSATRPPSATNLFYLRMNVVKALIELGRRERLAYRETVATEEVMQQLRYQWNELNRRLEEITRKIAETDRREASNREVVAEKNRLLAGIMTLAEEAGTLLGQAEGQIGLAERLDASGLVEDVVRLGQSVRSQNVDGLSPINLPVDETMLTALVTRFDLINERGSLADTWRRIKLAGDDLRSILNLRASHRLFTNSTVNRPFDFTFDESSTTASITFDAPLNRRAQRNAYRSALIDYQQALRNLMALEDEIKFSIRSNLRNLQLDREQYAIAVTSAALANDRVISTRKQFDLNLGDITARDFLESQRACTESLNSVASQHIDYILDRIQLFLDLELLTVDEQGFWPQLYEEDYRPEMRFQPPPGAGPAYGRLPQGLHYSKAIQRMSRVPFGTPAVLNNTTPAEQPLIDLPPEKPQLPVTASDEGGG